MEQKKTKFILDRADRLIIGVAAGLIVTFFIPYVLSLCTSFTLDFARLVFAVALFGVTASLIFIAAKYWRLKHTLEISEIWMPQTDPQGKRLNYRLGEAKEQYAVVSVTLNSMLQSTGIGVDFETLGRTMQKGLNLRFLVLHPESPHFRERSQAAHPNAADFVEIYNQKRHHLMMFIKTARANLGSNAQIRFYDTYPAWWIQMIDNSTVDPATQTKDSHLGQTYPLAIKLIEREGAC